MEKIILIIMQGLILILALICYRNATQILKDKKDEFKRISGQDYDTYMKNQKK